VSHIYNISGQKVNSVCGIVHPHKSLDVQINTRRIKFVKDMYKYHNHHAVLHKLYTWFGKNEFKLLKWIKNFFDWAGPSKYAHAKNACATVSNKQNTLKSTYRIKDTLKKTNYKE